MPTFDKEDFIGRTWLKGLSREAVRAAADKAQLLYLDDGHCLFCRGDKPVAFYIVVTGVVRFSRANDMGKEMILSLASSGVSFGEISILGDKGRGYLAQCVGDTSLLALGRDDFRALFEVNHEIRWRAVQQLCNRIDGYYDSVEDFLLLRLPARIAKRIVSLARAQAVHDESNLVLDAGLSQENIASMLGVSRQTLSKQLQEWRDAGWIDIRYGCIVIRNIDALVAVSEGAG
jgi:CRP/FNR family cyclic AMP-dependent transcriptional regulator